MKSRRKLAGVGLAAVIAALCVTPNATAAPGPAVSEAVKATPARSADCGASTLVLHPSDPKRALTAEDLGLSDPGTRQFLKTAAEKKVRWLTDIECKKSDLVFAIGSQKWAGYLASPTQGAPASAGMGWFEPNVTYPSAANGATAYSSVWPGIGGGNANPGQLVQAGTAQSVTSNGVQDHWFWFQVYPSIPVAVEVTTLDLSVGDAIGVNVSWSAGWAQFQICNWTKLQCYNTAVPSAGPGTTAEWLVEAPRSAVTGKTLPLANFGRVNIQGGTVSDGGGLKYINAANGQPVYMMNSTNTATKATPGFLNANGVFDVIWQRPL